jgi:hypothetical protein
MTAEVVYSYSGANHQTLGLLGLAGLVSFLIWFAPRDEKPSSHSAPRSPHRSPTAEESKSGGRRHSRELTEAPSEEDAAKAKQRERASRRAATEARIKGEANARSEDAARELREAHVSRSAPIKGSASMFVNSRAYGEADILDVHPPGSIRIPEAAWDFIVENMVPKLKSKSAMSLEQIVKEAAAPLSLFHLHYVNGYRDAADGTLSSEPQARDENANALWNHQHELVRLAKSVFQWKLRTGVGANLGPGCIRLSLPPTSSRYDVTVFLPPKSKSGSWDADWEASFAVLESVLAMETYDQSKDFNLLVRPGTESAKAHEPSQTSADSSRTRWSKGVADRIKQRSITHGGLSESFAQVLRRLRPKRITILAEPQHAYAGRAWREHSLRAEQLAEFVEGARTYRETAAPVSLAMLDCGSWLPRSGDGDFPLSDWFWISNLVITVSGLPAEAKEDVYRLLWQSDNSLFSLLAAGSTNICLCLETPSDLAMLKHGLQKYCAAHLQTGGRNAKYEVRERIEIWNRSLTFAYRDDNASALEPEEINFKLRPLGN